MALIDDLKERLKAGAERALDRVTESAAFNQLKDRYQNFSPLMQKLFIGGTIFVVLALLLSVPMTSFLGSTDDVGKFEEQRDLIRDMFKLQQDTQNTAGLVPAPAMDALILRINSDLKNAQLLPEQIKGVTTDAPPANLPKEHIDGALRVALGKLNLRQVVDIGYQITAISPALKMTDMSIEANLQDGHYFDVVYKVVSLKVPSVLPMGGGEEETPSKGNKKSPAKPKAKAIDE